MGRPKWKRDRKKLAQATLEKTRESLKQENNTKEESVYSVYSDLVISKVIQTQAGKYGKRKRDIRTVARRRQRNRLREAAATERLSPSEYVNLLIKVASKADTEGTKLGEIERKKKEVRTF